MTAAITKLALVGLDWDLIDLIEDLKTVKLIGVFDKQHNDHDGGPPLLGKDDDWPNFKLSEPDVKVVLAVDLPVVRKRLYDSYGEESILGVTSAHSYCSRYAKIGFASVIQRAVTIMPKVIIGKACKLHLNVTVHHEVQISNFCTIGPGAQILGNVRVGECTYIGAGAIIRQRCVIGRNCTIGAGAVVVNNIPDNTVVVGVPAKRVLPQ